MEGELGCKKERRSTPEGAKGGTFQRNPRGLNWGHGRIFSVPDAEQLVANSRLQRSIKISHWIMLLLCLQTTIDLVSVTE